MNIKITHIIASNELRIGNWVKCLLTAESHDREDFRIIGVTEENVYLNAITWDYLTIEDLQPIPLSDAILEKLPQFKKVPFLDEDGHYYEFDLDCGLCLLSGDNNDVFVCDLDNVRFEYLHQLQNFVASLGKELEVNL